MNTGNGSDICFINYQVNKINCDRFTKMAIAKRKSEILLYIPKINIEKYIERGKILLSHIHAGLTKNPCR
jgi:hypothetical protein